MVSRLSTDCTSSYGYVVQSLKTKQNDVVSSCLLLLCAALPPTDRRIPGTCIDETQSDVSVFNACQSQPRGAVCRSTSRTFQSPSPRRRSRRRRKGETRATRTGPTQPGSLTPLAAPMFPVRGYAALLPWAMMYFSDSTCAVYSKDTHLRPGE